MVSEKLALKDSRTLEIDLGFDKDPKVINLNKILESEMAKKLGIKYPEGKIVKTERIESEIERIKYAEVRTYENGAKELYIKYKYTAPSNTCLAPCTETLKEKLERKKRERMGSLPEKTKRKVGKWRF